MRKTLVFAVVAIFAGAAALAENATVVNYQTTQLSSRETQSGSMYFGDNRLKIVTAAQGGVPATEFIYRGDMQLVWIVNHSRKSYVQMDRDTMREMADRFAGVSKQLEAQLAQLPPEQRAQAERMLKGRIPAAPEPEAKGELRKTSERREINGYPCVKYDFHLNGALDSELWVTRDSELNFSSMAELLRKMGEFYSGLTKSLPAGSRSGDFDFKALSELDGFPILIRNIDTGKAVSETEIQSIRRESVKAGFFDAPEGYQQLGPMQGFDR